MLSNYKYLKLSEGPMKNIRWILVLFILIFNFSIFAQTINENDRPKSINGFLYLSTNKVLSWLDEEFFKLKDDSGKWTNKITFNGELPFEISGFDYQIKNQQIKSQYLKSDEIQIAVDNLQVNVTIPKVVIDTIVSKNIGGAIVNIKVKSECENVQLNFESTKAFASGKLKDVNKENKIYLQASDVQSKFENQNLNVVDFNCTNINGFQEFVKNQIYEEFKKFNFYQLIFDDKISKLINEKLSEISNKANSMISQKLSAIDDSSLIKYQLVNTNEKYFKILIEFPLPESISDKVSAKTSADKKAKEEAFQKKSDEFVTDNLIDEAIIALPHSLVQIWALKQIQLKLSQEWISSKKIPALNKLTNSRFQQFFVFPALMSLPKGQELLLHPYLERLEYNIEKNKFLSQLETKASVGAWIYDRSHPMVFFRSNLNFKFQLGENSQLLSNLQSIQSESLFNNEYLKNNNVSTYISTSIISSSMQSYFNQNYIRQNLNLFQITNDKVFKIKDFYLSSDDILFLRAAKLK